MSHVRTRDQLEEEAGEGKGHGCQNLIMWMKQEFKVDGCNLKQSRCQERNDNIDTTITGRGRGRGVRW